jgi:hypothetical protein
MYTVAGCRPALHLAILRKDLVSSLMLISPGFYYGEGPQVKAVFTELRDIFLETNEKVLRGEVAKNHPERLVDADALHAYINYTFGQCLNEEQADFEMDRVSSCCSVSSFVLLLGRSRVKGANKQS